MTPHLPGKFFSIFIIAIIALGVLGVRQSLRNGEEDSFITKEGKDIEALFQKKIEDSISREFSAYKPTLQTPDKKKEQTERQEEIFLKDGSTEGATDIDIKAADPPQLMEPPKHIKAIYLTAYTAMSPPRHESILSLMEGTELNAIVVNVKDGEGIFQGPSMKEFVQIAKEKGIWMIGRIVVVQDNSLVAQRPHLALRDENGEIWKDPLGLFWVDPASPEVWEYNVQIAKEIMELGFDELNFDYIRFPSDGATEKIQYPYWKEEIPRAEVMKQFFAHLTTELKKYNPDVYLSVDLFAYNLLASITHDTVIGQQVEDAALYFDILAPMVYPSHYLSGNFGFDNPAEHPYEIVHQTLQQGVEKVLKVRDKAVIRPWLQAFNMGAEYDKAMIDLERQAVKDAGLDYGWMLWNPNNIYLWQWFGPPEPDLSIPADPVESIEISPEEDNATSSEPSKVIISE